METEKQLHDQVLTLCGYSVEFFPFRPLRDDDEEGTDFCNAHWELMRNGAVEVDNWRPTPEMAWEDAPSIDKVLLSLQKAMTTDKTSYLVYKVDGEYKAEFRNTERGGGVSGRRRDTYAKAIFGLFISACGIDLIDPKTVVIA